MNRQRKPAWRNVGAAERWASVLGGGAMIAYAFRERGTPAWALGLSGGALALIGISGYCPVYAAAGIDTTGEEGLDVDCSVSIDRPAHELYRFWRQLETLPTVMNHLVSITARDKTHSHWVAKAPAGRTVEWDAEITADVPNRKIAWASLPGSDVDSEGMVTFEPSGDNHSTFVRVRMRYIPPAGIEGAAVAKLLGEEPSIQLDQDLQRLKQLMETGEIASAQHEMRRSRRPSAARAAA